MSDRDRSGDPGVSHGEEEASEDKFRQCPPLKTHGKEQNDPRKDPGRTTAGPGAARTYFGSGGSFGGLFEIF